MTFNFIDDRYQKHDPNEKLPEQHIEKYFNFERFQAVDNI